VLHLGDYIYEYDAYSAYPDRQHTAPESSGLDQLSTLDDYRNRHARYKTENNYAGLVDEVDDTGPQGQTPEQFTARVR
jgi:alkaline phosphatase D